MSEKHPSCVPSPLIITLSENLICSPSEVSRSLPKIMSYLLSSDSSTWHFRVTVFVALSYGRQKSTFAFFGVVNFLYWVSHVVCYSSFALSCDIILSTTIVEILPLFKIIWNIFNFAFPLQVFIQLCRIGEGWLFLDFAHFLAFKILDIKLHYCLILLSLFIL